MIKDVKAKEKLKLDQIMRVLFTLSKRVIVNLMNGLFDENFSSDKVTIEYSNGEFVKDDYERITADMYITIRKKQHVYRYHIEFQTLNDQTMALRMFMYGFKKAEETAGTDINENIELEFPRQLVIFLEENDNIKDQLSFILKLPDGNNIKYTVPVIKYWKYTAEDLKNKKMYALLPLQVFKFMKRIRYIYNRRIPEEEKAQLINTEFDKLIDTIGSTIKVLEDLHESNELLIKDLEKILRVITNITEYLYNKYGEYNKIGKEVKNMVTTLYNPAIKRAAKIEGKIEDILVLLEELSTIDDDLRKRIKEEKDIEVLKRWLKLAAKAESLNEFTAQM